MSEGIIDIILVVVYLSIAVALGCVVWSVWRGWRKRSKVKREEKFAQQTSVGVALLTVAVLALALLCSSADPLKIAGETYSDSLWLRVADIFVYSIASMLIILVVGVVGFWIRKKILR